MKRSSKEIGCPAVFTSSSTLDFDLRGLKDLKLVSLAWKNKYLYC